ncbi:hypothetical protein MUN86_28145 (plasmid) [Hymenobacter volaticus]|uniref:Uncharacterized protein n=1 Tax=Hymenobacter volaticus TaxID=2932254 RepID=A0ABY4GFE0_9BACT|nr:hypothetical protein MUN86_28145 [Hymenobacter volaticus]
MRNRIGIRMAPFFHPDGFAFSSGCPLDFIRMRPEEKRVAVRGEKLGLEGLFRSLLSRTGYRIRGTYKLNRGFIILFLVKQLTVELIGQLKKAISAHLTGFHPDDTSQGEKYNYSTKLCLDSWT